MNRNAGFSHCCTFLGISYASIAPLRLFIIFLIFAIFSFFFFLRGVGGERERERERESVCVCDKLLHLDRSHPLTIECYHIIELH